MTTLTDHDRRQLRRIAERLELFSKGELALSVLIADIEFLLSALDAADESVRQHLREHWTVLEEVYSVALTMHAGKLDAQSESLIQNGVAHARGGNRGSTRRAVSSSQPDLLIRLQIVGSSWILTGNRVVPVA